MTFKLSYSKLFQPSINFILLFIIGVIFGVIYAGGIDKIDSETIFYFALMVGILALPTFYICVEYYVVTRNKTIEITSEYIDIASNKNNSRYLIRDLDYIELYKSAGMEKGDFAWTIVETYYHAEVFTNDGKKIILTSVLEPSIDEALALLKDIRVEVKRTAYSTIYW